MIRWAITWALLTALAFTSLADTVRDYTTRRRYTNTRSRTQIVAAVVLFLSGLVAAIQI